MSYAVRNSAIMVLLVILICFFVVTADVQNRYEWEPRIRCTTLLTFIALHNLLNKQYFSTGTMWAKRRL